MHGHLHGSVFGPAMALWFEQGLWVPSTAFMLAANAVDGDTSILVNAVPAATNMFAQVDATIPSPPGSAGNVAEGHGKYLIIDPASAAVQVQVRRKWGIITEGSSVRIHLDEPLVLSATIVIGKFIGMGYSPVVEAEAWSRDVRLIATSHYTNARGTTGQTTDPNLTVKLYGGDSQDGPFHFVSMVALAFSGVNAASGDIIQSAELNLPTLPYFRFEAIPNSGDATDTIFSISMARGA